MWTDEGTSLVREGVECASGDEDLGTFADIQSCAAACRLATGCDFFIFGKGSKSGRCYHEHTATRECSEGWEVDEYDFYELPRICRADICGDNGNDCCAPGNEPRVCTEPGYSVAPGGTTSWAPCPADGVYQCCTL